MVCDTLCNCSLFVFAHTQLTDPKRTNSEFVFFNAAVFFALCCLRSFELSSDGSVELEESRTHIVHHIVCIQIAFHVPRMMKNATLIEFRFDYYSKAK